MNFPIRARLTVVYCTLFCLSMLLIEAGAYFGLSASIYAVVDRELEARLLGVVDFLYNHASRFPLARLQAELKTHEALQPELLAIFDEGRREIFQAAQMREFADVKHREASTVVWTARTKLAPLRVLTVRRTIRGQEYDLHLATDLTVPSEIMRRFRWIPIFTAPVMLACASIAGYWISGRALAPVSELIRAAGTIGAANLGQRVKVPQSGDEIESLALTLNGMLTRIEDAFRHVTQFTADASHELRTPLAVMRATAEVALLRATGNADSYREALHRILSEAERNTILLDNMLHLARADSGTWALELRPADLGRNLRRACGRVELLAREKNIALRVEIADEPLCIAADADHLLRLCLILLDNAIKYTPAGGTITAVASGGVGVASLEVRDSGIGIAARDLPRIFSRFFRADEARTKGHGAGLGLSIAQWIVEAHHAKIFVSSKPGEGSTFRVEFPGISRAPEGHADPRGAVQRAV